MHPVLWAIVGAGIVLALLWLGLATLRAWLDNLRGRVDDYNGGADW